jgi:hypothetical protein
MLLETQRRTFYEVIWQGHDNRDHDEDFGET